MARKQTVITHPVARSEDLLVETVGDESVIFDTRSRASHALKPLAAAVFMYADGSNSLADIAELASHRLADQVSEADVAEVLALLTELDLLEAPGAEASGLSRRDALKTFAAVGAGAALVTTVTAGSAMAATSQGALGDNDSCVAHTGTAMVPSSGTYQNSVFPQPGTTSYTIGSHTFYNLAGGATYGYNSNPNAVDPSKYGSACTYLKYTSGQGGTGNRYNYAPTTGKWQCVPCDGPDYQCCQVVCGPSSMIGYGWGASASPPPGYSKPYIGCGTDNFTSGCPQPGQPDYWEYLFYGKYCTTNGGKPGS